MISIQNIMRVGMVGSLIFLTCGARRGGAEEPKPVTPATPPQKRPAVGSANDRGKLVPGLRAAGLPPVLVEGPDLTKLPWVLRNGAKEFHLRASHLRREFLPGFFADVWGFNRQMPGPTIEVTEGDKVRIIVQNDLPESTAIHWHGLEVPFEQDGVPHLGQDAIAAGHSKTYEFELTQNGTFFYHSHDGMQDGMGMVGFFIVHPMEAYEPRVDRDIALVVQEWPFLPGNSIPSTVAMEFNVFTINGRSAPMTTPIVLKQGERVRFRILNFSPIDHHPMHLHGLTFWTTGTEGGRIPDTAWIPGNNVLVGVAQVRDIEFIANNPGDWMFHCHMFHHMMNFMSVSGEKGAIGVMQSGPMPGESIDDWRKRKGPLVPGFPQGMMDMAKKYSSADLMKLNKKETIGMRKDWFQGMDGLMNIVRVLPAEKYDEVMKLPAK